jgi:antirestriction protein ArdC
MPIRRTLTRRRAKMTRAHAGASFYDFIACGALEQCALPQAVLDKLPAVERHQYDPIEAAEKIIAKMPNPPEITLRGIQGLLQPAHRSDRPTLSRALRERRRTYHSATTFHELAHGSGHRTRLNRESIIEAAPFGSPVYCREELVAEMCVAFLCAEADISPVIIENQAAYIQGWLARLRDDRRLVILAAAQAQDAAEYILGRTAAG